MTKCLPRKGESKVMGGMIVICGDCINAAYAKALKHKVGRSFLLNSTRFFRGC